MAVKNLYLMGGTLQNGYQPMQEDGVAPADAAFATATGWIVAAVAGGNYVGFRANTERASTGFTTTAQPDTEGLISGATGNAFRAGPFSGTFAAGDWTLSAVLRSVTAAMATGQTGTLRWRIFASANADGTGSRELTGAVVESNTVAGTGNTTANQAARTATWAAPAVVVNNEYLFFVNAYRIVATSGTGNTRDANFRQNSASVITTPDLSAGVALSKTVTDSLGMLDLMTRSKQRGMSENLGLLDAALPVKGRIMGDSLGLLDAIAMRALSRSLSTDFLGLSDSYSQARSRVATDLLGLSESMSRILTRPVSENLALTDLAVPVRGRILSDALGLSDAYARGIARNLFDSMGLSESIQLARGRGVLDLLGLSDPTTRRTGRALSDSLGLLDPYNTTQNIHRLATDTLGLTDEIVPSGTGRITRIVSDIVGISDSYSPSIAVVRNVTDPLGLVDAISAQRGISALIADSLGVVDSAIQRTGLGVVVADSLSLLDEVTPVRKIERVATDALGLVDSYVVPGGVIIVDRMSQIVGFAILPAFGVAQVRLLPGIEASVDVIAAMIARGEIIG